MPTEPNDWPGSEESIAARANEITGPDAARAASNILMCIGRGETVTISIHFAIEAVAGLRMLARVAADTNPSNELLGPLLDRFIADARELRYRVMDLPKPKTPCRCYCHRIGMLRAKERAG